MGDFACCVLLLPVVLHSLPTNDSSEEGDVCDASDQESECREQDSDHDAFDRFDSCVIVFFWVEASEQFLVHHWFTAATTEMADVLVTVPPR